MPDFSSISDLEVCQFQGSESLICTAEEAFDVLQDLTVFERAFPGCKSLTVDEESVPWGESGCHVLGVNSLLGWNMEGTIDLLHVGPLFLQFKFGTSFMQGHGRLKLSPSPSGSTIEFSVQLQEDEGRKYGMLSPRIFWSVFSKNTLRSLQRIIHERTVAQPV